MTARVAPTDATPASDAAQPPEVADRHPVGWRSFQKRFGARIPTHMPAMFLVHAPSEQRTLPLDGPPHVIFTRMAPASDRWCVECGSPHMYLVEDFAGVGWLRRGPGHQPLTYLQCDSCGSREEPSRELA